MAKKKTISEASSSLEDKESSSHRSISTRARSRPISYVYKNEDEGDSDEDLHDMQTENDPISDDDDDADNDSQSENANANTNDLATKSSSLSAHSTGQAMGMKKTADAAPRVNHKKPLPVVKTPVSKRPTGRSTVTQALSLSDALQASRVNVKVIVRDWIQHYTKDATSGIYSLVLLLLKSAGYNGPFGYETFHEPDVASILSQIQSSDTQLFVKDYPIHAKGKGLKAYRRHYIDFFAALISESSQGLLFEQGGKMIQGLLNWIIAMSSCHYRPFRVTSTLAGLTLAQGLCLAARECHTELDRMQKGAGARAKDQKAILVRVELLQTLLETIFNGIFVHRYRDIDPSIRSMCIESLGEWIETFPETFLDNSYLRYLGWVLSDKAPETRLSALKSFMMLIEHQSTETAIAGMRSFIERFRPRLIEICTRDKDLNCQIMALNLMSHLRRYDLLDRESESRVLELIFSPNLGLRAAAGAVLVSCLKCGPIVERWRDAHVLFPYEADPVHSGVLRNEFILFKSVIEWSLSYLSQQRREPASDSPIELSPHLASLIVDALWETYHAEFSNVGCWFQYLTMDHSKSLAELPTRAHLWTLLSSAAEETALISFMDAAMKRAAKSTADASEFQKTCTTDIVSAWGFILGQYRSAYTTLCVPLSWLGQPALFSPSALLSLPKAWLQTLSELYSSVRDVFLMPVPIEFQSTVWRLCIKVFKAGFDTEPAFRSEKLSLLRDTFIALTTAMQDVAEDPMPTLGRLEALLICFDLKSLFPFEFEDLERVVGSLVPRAELASLALKLQWMKTWYRMLLWNLLKVTLDQSSCHALQSTIQSQVDRIVTLVESLVASPDAGLAVNMACLAIYSDVLVIFRGFESAVPESIAGLVRLPSYLTTHSKEGALIVAAFEKTCESVLQERLHVGGNEALGPLVERVQERKGEAEREAFLSSYAKLFVQKLVPMQCLVKLVQYVGMLPRPFAASFSSLVSLILDQGFDDAGGDDDRPGSVEAFSLANFYSMVAHALIGSFEMSHHASYEGLMSLGKYLYGYMRQVTPPEKALKAMRSLLEPLMRYIRAHLHQKNILVFFQVLTAQPWLSLLNTASASMAPESVFSMQLVSLPFDSLTKLSHLESYESFKKGLETKLQVLGQRASRSSLSMRTRNQLQAQRNESESSEPSTEPLTESDMTLSPILTHPDRSGVPHGQGAKSSSTSHSASHSSGDQSNFWTLKSDDGDENDDDDASSSVATGSEPEPNENVMPVNRKRPEPLNLAAASLDSKKSKLAPSSQVAYEFPTSPIL